MRKTAKAESRTKPLDRLAALLGIESEYRDARGNPQRTSASTKRALLAAMGFGVADDLQIGASLTAIFRAQWTRAFEPVYVVPADKGPIKVGLNFPRGAAETSWRLRLEDGAKRTKKVRLSELPLAAQRKIDGRVVERRQLSIGGDIPCGYHHLSIGDGAGEALLIVAPERCWLPPSVDAGEKIWGIAAQLYGVNSQENWGIGDFADLRRLAESWTTAGANMVGVNPLHALFPDTPEHASPYSPSSRLLLNILYIDVTAVPGFSECTEAQALVRSAEFRQRLVQARSVALVNYSLVANLKMRVLRMLFQRWIASSPASQIPFKNFRRERGEILENASAFHCLRQMFVSRDPALNDWRKWPPEYRHPASEAVCRFAREQDREITFFVWMQWLADLQLSLAAKAAGSMEIGLYRDLAVGADMAGVETWSNQNALVSGAHVGAPPDIFNPAGQDWNLPPFHPRALKEQGYKGFIDLIRANMRYAGALRIDHVMALQHLYWIPASQSPDHGAYVRYAMEDLVGILALESQRNHCMIIGEDLGTVPDGFRERMAEARILSYRVMFFEQNTKTGVFRKPKDYPQLAVAVASNHDLPTVPAWWLGRDIELRDQRKLYPDSREATYQLKLRERDKNQLRKALQSQRLLRRGAPVTADELVLLVYAYLAGGSSFAALLQLDDVTGEIDPVNLPGSTDQYPNWRRKLSVPLEELLQKPIARKLVRIFTKARGSVPPVLEKSAQ